MKKEKKMRIREKEGRMEIKGKNAFKKSRKKEEKKGKKKRQTKRKEKSKME